MSLLHQSQHFLLFVTAVGQRRGQQDLDVVATQQWIVFGVTDPNLQHEQPRHHHQDHVSMPGLPHAGLILRHSDVTLGVLERSLDPELLDLHLRRKREFYCLYKFPEAVRGTATAHAEDFEAVSEIRLDSRIRCFISSAKRGEERCDVDPDVGGPYCGRGV
ncbi:hypothetical protein [Steroidobacter sp.]|uniref:hypothetical protein n=1 Tax=Steroidobacter sp. TaxID=1978227 RepID=UPI001A52D322|nr:hypothetical protein [Steroidobacter sp.]MBL8264857.1 hypothetical protein [Steroidobacter sp.]